ncbi:CBO0543 family protein [Parageobacillus genomosp. 1]|nr:CBO0543 family protein [Parageobacillus genomosp. 1]
MPIVKRSKKWNWRSSPKTPSFIRTKRAPAYISTLFFASWIGTYLDLYFVGNGWYHFPHRPFPAIFSIDLSFTLIGLPLFVTFFLYVMARLHPWQRGGFLIAMGLFMTWIEKQAETIGWFVHSSEWKHLYSFVGYSLFMAMVWRFYRWMNLH